MLLCTRGSSFPKHLCDESRQFENSTARNQCDIYLLIIEVIIRSNARIVIAISTSTEATALTILINMNYIAKGRLKY